MAVRAGVSGVIVAVLAANVLFILGRRVFIVINGEERGNMIDGDWWGPRLIGTLTLFAYIAVIYCAVRLLVTAI